jgi:hypothetical protein
VLATTVVVGAYPLHGQALSAWSASAAASSGSTAARIRTRRSSLTLKASERGLPARGKARPITDPFQGEERLSLTAAGSGGPLLKRATDRGPG